MTQEFSLDQKRTTILVVVFVVLIFLVFVAGYLSGTLVGLPEQEQPPIVKRPSVTPPPKPPVQAIQVPQVVTQPVPLPEEAVAEPEPEPELLKEAPVEKLYSVQVGAFRTLARATAQQETLADKGYRPYIYHGPNSKGAMWYTVRVGDFDDVDEAILSAREFRALEGTSAALTHYDSLMMVRDANGKRIEIAPPEKPATRTAAGDEKNAETDLVEVATEPEPVAEAPEPWRKHLNRWRKNLNRWRKNLNRRRKNRRVQLLTASPLRFRRRSRPSLRLSKRTRARVWPASSLPRKRNNIPYRSVPFSTTTMRSSSPKSSGATTIRPMCFAIPILRAMPGVPSG